MKDENVKFCEEEKVKEKVGEKEAVTIEQQVEEAEKKLESSVEEKDEILVVDADVSNDASVGKEGKKSNADQR
ncbi:hypothetical protein Hanom_Chr10g00899731 [Helianthus anomalus]